MTALRAARGAITDGIAKSSFARKMQHGGYSRFYPDRLHNGRDVGELSRRRGLREKLNGWADLQTEKAVFLGRTREKREKEGGRGGFGGTED